MSRTILDESDHGVRQRGTAEAGMKFIGDGGAADLRRRRGERLESGFGE